LSKFSGVRSNPLTGRLLLEGRLWKDSSAQANQPKDSLLRILDSGPSLPPPHSDDLGPGHQAAWSELMESRQMNYHIGKDLQLSGCWRRSCRKGGTSQIPQT
ncbi:hypothetical protein GDO81_013715, partial [Engystomops pustulosus]